MPKNLKYFIKTFGCTYNKNSSQIMEGLLIKNNFNKVKNYQDSDIIIINTCVVKINTEDKIFHLITQITQKYPNKMLIIAGCMAETMFESVKEISPKVNLLGPFYCTEIVNFINNINQESVPQILIGKRVENKLNQPKILRSKLIDIIPISQGCVNNCTYCIVKKAMGNLYSYPKEAIIKSIRESINRGIKEIRLTSQDLSAYGQDSSSNLAEIIKEINKVDEIFMVRLGMMNPSTLFPIIGELLDACNGQKIYKFFHIPIQSGDDQILNDMNRKYSVSDFLTINNTIKSKFPDYSLATDIICGYPTETEENFENTLNLIKKIKPNIVNISKYSHRPGTISSKLKDLPTEIKKSRSKTLTKIVNKIGREKFKRSINKNYDAIFLRKESKDLYWGRTQNYYPVYIKTEKNIIGNIFNIKIFGYQGNRLIGELND